MRITDVRTAVIAGNFDWVLVRVDTDEGLSGLGEAYWGAGVAELVHAIKPIIIGEHPFNIAKLVAKMLRGMSGAGSLAGATVTAISGIELALWDLLGRALNVPISTLLGGRFRDRVLVYADCHGGRGHTYTPEAYAERAREVLAAGFTALKFDIDVPNPYQLDVSDSPEPRRSWYEPYSRIISPAERDFIVSLVAAVREAIGPHTMLAIDCHWKFNVIDATLLAQALEPYNLLWLEDPIPPENVDALAKVAASTRTPICTGENVYRTHGYRELIEKQAADILSPDIPKMGGLLEARKVADHADQYYIPIAPHNVCSPIGTVAAAHLCAAIPNFLALEFHAFDVPWWGDLVEGGPIIRDGYITLTDAPGHGLTLNEDVARAHLKEGSSFFGPTPYAD
ncbi:MAG: mandelate racemase/muconate lactonizing enzyme family protein [Thermorudis peleae]|nr:mandelate racemase/muconate lactonizing enzyme family protein [Thermorudis peleae]